MKELVQHISKELSAQLVVASQLDEDTSIKKAILRSSDLIYFLKYCDTPIGSDQLKSEVEGLGYLHRPEIGISTPEVLLSGHWKQLSYLLMEYIESKSPTSKDLYALGSSMADLHLMPQREFGWHRNNFIGPLPQQNGTVSSWPNFYIHHRIIPQIRMAIDLGHIKSKNLPDESTLYSNLQDILQEACPSLLHGDLWSGNYIISASGKSFLIDPAIYIGDKFVDIAMSQLFGGFQSSFYEAYFSKIEKPDHYAQLIDAYQAYYLLVHLNLFGHMYRDAVVRVLQRLVG